MSNPNTDRNERVNAAPKHLYRVTDIASQFHGNVYENRTDESDIEYVRADIAATAMRDRCVAKVKEMGEQWRQEASRAGRMFSDKTNIATQIAKALESLVIEAAANRAEGDGDG